jgi:hypothetical protein
VHTLLALGHRIPGDVKIVVLLDCKLGVRKSCGSWPITSIVNVFYDLI